jgi:Zn-dependent oligopeptidase
MKFAGGNLALSSLLIGNISGKAVDLRTITNLMSDAKSEAAVLNSGAQELNSFAHSTAGWQTHAAKLNEMKEHVNKVSSIVQHMNNIKDAGSQWQQIAIDRIAPALNELASNLQATIEHMREN